jgi:hypothetical protein
MPATILGPTQRRIPTDTTTTTRTIMTGLYVKLDTNWPDNPKVIAAGLDGAGLHALALCLAKRFLSDGVIHRAQLLRIGATDDLIDRLLELGLFDPVDNERVAVHDWLDRNPSRGAIGGRLGAMSLDGKRGNHKRWKHGGDVVACQICNPTNNQDNRVGDRGAIGSGLGGRSHPIHRDRDRDRDNSDEVAAAQARAQRGNGQIRAILAEPPPSSKTISQGIAAARAASSTPLTPKCLTCDDHGWTYRPGTNIADGCPDCNPAIESETEHAKRPSA